MKSTTTILFALFCIASSSKVSQVPDIEIIPGVYMPIVGMGTWLYNDSVVYDEVTTGLQIGYRAIDTAFDYGNAKGIAAAIKDSNISRSDLWITTKVEGGLNFTETASEALSQLEELNTTYVDLLLVHFPFNADGTNFSAEGRAIQWEAMESLYNLGFARSIGVSHFCRSQMEELLKTAKIKPAYNQVQYHIGMGTADGDATDDKQWMQEQGIIYAPFSELCGPCCMGQPSNCTLNKELIDGALVTEIGSKYNVTGAQVSLKWLVQQGLPIIPKSHHPAYLEQNIDLFDFTLSEEDMATLTAATSPSVAGGPDGSSGDCDFA